MELRDELKNELKVRPEEGAAILWVGATVLGVASLNPSFFLGAWIEALVVALDLGGSGWIAYSVWQQPIARMP